MRHAFTIGPPDAGRRVDRFVRSALRDAPFTLVQRLLRQGKVRVNGTRAKGNQRLELGDEVVVHRVTSDGPKVTETAPYEGPLIDVLHRCEEYLVVDKPAGVTCSMDPRPERSLPVWVEAELAREMASGELRPSLCHRLDAGTTGIVVIALTAAATTAFHAALSERRVEKIYQVAVWGEPEAEFAVDLPLQRQPHSRRTEPKVVAGEAGQEARTEFRRLAAGPAAAWLEAHPITGRTHQIRAHLLASGWPVVGDRRYGNPRRDAEYGLELDHQLLHAARLSFPTAQGPVEVTAPLPSECTAALKLLDLGSSL